MTHMQHWLIAAPILCVAVGALSGCESPEAIRAHDQSTCTSYGFAPGSEGFAKCMMRQDDKRAQYVRDMQRQHAAQSGQSPQSGASTPMQPSNMDCKTTEQVASTQDGNNNSGSSTTTSHSSTVCHSR